MNSENTDHPVARFFGGGESAAGPAVAYIRGETGRTGPKGDPGDADETLAAIAARVAALDDDEDAIRNFAALKAAFLQLVRILENAK